MSRHPLQTASYRRAYNRTAHLLERHKMMQQWADYLDKVKAGAEVIPLDRNAQVVAEFERSMIQERVRAGLDRARAQGKILGRPRVSPRTESLIRHKRGQGMGILKIAKEVGVGTSVVQRVLKAA